MKRKTFISISAHIVALVSVILFSSCRSQLRPPSVTLKEEVVRIPMRIASQRFFSYVVVESDTVRMLIDTGSTGSSFNYESAAKTGRIAQVIDGGGISKFMPIRRINKMQWGDLRVEDLLVAGGTEFNIIGDDILRHFIVQFDNENQEIVLTQNASLIEKRGVRVPFSRGGNNNQVLVSLSLNGEEGVFLLDTGYFGELKVDADFFYASGLSDLENMRWRGHLGSSLFLPEYLWGEGVSYMTLARHELGGMIFDNAIVTHCIHWHSNVLGFVFLQRFRTFTIDYINGYVYFELPERTIFSDDNVIETVPPAYMDFLRRYINSFGIHFQNERDAMHGVSMVSSLLEDDTRFARIEIGDTLIGINQTAFTEAAFYKLEIETDTFCLYSSRTKRVLLTNHLNSVNEATFHFLKNGELISINRVRDRILYPEPRVVRIFMDPMLALILQRIEDGRTTGDIIKDDYGNIIRIENIQAVPQ